MDRLLSACGMGSAEERVMDSGDLERERGITILAKVGHKLTLLAGPQTYVHRN